MGGDRPIEGCASPTFELGTYDLKMLNKENITPEESFMDAYVEKLFKY